MPERKALAFIHECDVRCRRSKEMHIDAVRKIRESKELVQKSIRLMATWRRSHGTENSTHAERE